MDIPDVSHVVASHCGEHLHGLIDRTNLRACCRSTKHVPCLPVVNGICTIHLVQSLNVARDLHVNYVPVYDTLAGKCVHIAHQHLKFDFDNKPCKSARLYPPANAIVWSPKDNIWACTPVVIAQLWQGKPPTLQLNAETSFQANGEPVVTLTKRGMSPITRDNIRLANLVEFVGIQLTTDRRLHHLALVACDNSPGSPMTVSMTPIVRKIPPNLVKLSFVDIHIPLADVELILHHAADFELLEITNSYTLASASSRTHAIFLQLTEIIASWRKKGDNRVRKLILDGIQLPFLHLVIYAVCHPNYVDMSDMYTAMLSNDVYFSASGCSEGMWAHAFEEAQLLKQLDYPTVSLKCKKGNLKKNGKTTAPKAPPAPPSSAPMSANDAKSYTNARRETMRYMWQFEDFTCKNCSTVWPKHSVTISWRQTCASECLKGKKLCSSRPEYARVQNGDLFITDKHVVGNGGLDMTPLPQETLTAEESGKLVAIDATTHTMITWQHF